MNIWVFIIILILVFPIAYTSVLHIRRYRNEKDIYAIDEDLFFERYDGAVIEHYSEIIADHYILKDKVREREGTLKLQFPRLKIRGRKKRVLYLTSFQKSADDIYAFYLQQFERKDYRLLYSVYEDEFAGKPGDWLSALYLRTTRLISGMHVFFRGKMLCYLSGVRDNHNGRKEYASIFVLNSGVRKGYTGILVQIIEPEPADFLN